MDAAPMQFRRPGQNGRDGARRAWFDVSTWSGALLFMLGVALVLWIVQIVNASDGYGLNRFGLQPRAVNGLWGVVTEPFLHASYGHMLSNTIPVVAIGWVLLLAGLRSWLIVSAIVIVGGGVLTWLVGPAHTEIVGASGMVFGWLGYLLARAYFSRRVQWIIVAVLVLFFFGTLLSGLLPTLHSDEAWQAHVCGFVAGVGAGALLHPRHAARGRSRSAPVS